MSIESGGYIPPNTEQNTTTKEAPISEQLKAEMAMEKAYNEFYPKGGNLTVSFANHAMTDNVFERCSDPDVITGEIQTGNILGDLYSNPSTIKRDKSTRYGGIGVSTEEMQEHLKNLHKYMTTNPTYFIPTDAPLTYFYDEFKNGLLKEPISYTNAYEKTKKVVDNALSIHALAIVTGATIAPEVTQEIVKAHKQLEQSQSLPNPQINRRQFLKLAASEGLALTLAVTQARLLEKLAKMYIPGDIDPDTYEQFVEKQIKFEENLPNKVYDSKIVPFTQALLEFRNTIMAYNLHRLGEHFTKQNSNPKILSYYGSGHAELIKEFEKTPDQLKTEIETYIKRAIYELPLKLQQDGLTSFEIGRVVGDLALSFPDTPIFDPNDEPLMVESQYASPRSLFVQELQSYLAQHTEDQSDPIYNALDSTYRLAVTQTLYDQFDAGIVSTAMKNEIAPTTLTTPKLAGLYLNVRPSSNPNSRPSKTIDHVYNTISKADASTFAVSSRLFGGGKRLDHWLYHNFGFDKYGNLVQIGWYDDKDDTNGEFDIEGVIIKNRFYRRSDEITR